MFSNLSLDLSFCPNIYAFVYVLYISFSICLYFPNFVGIVTVLVKTKLMWLYSIKTTGLARLSGLQFIFILVKMRFLLLFCLKAHALTLYD